jgi:UDP-N-acetylmuramyl pentapeptide phosphotransferase/UDP-N-acetylglucosamine-1-phosphate transferase
MVDEQGNDGYPPPPGAAHDTAPDPAAMAALFGEPPAQVNLAVRLMFVRAAVSVVSLVLLYTTRSSLRAALRKQNKSDDAHQLNQLVSTAVGVSLVIGLIFIVLYVLLALQVRAGKNWARIVTFVLAGLGVLGLLASFARAEAGPTVVTGVIVGVIDLAIIYLLAQSASAGYFRRTP